VTTWEEYLSGFSPADRAEFLAWYETRPEPIQRLIRSYPAGVGMSIDGRTAWVVSYCETEGGDPGVMFSHTDPRSDYEGAMAARFFVCADHLTLESP
jgi:hypothetical protein